MDESTRSIMELNLILFGIARDIVGSNKTSISLTNGATVCELRETLLNHYPRFTDLRSVMIAVNSEYAADDVLLREQDEIAIIPPVSGG